MNFYAGLLALSLLAIANGNFFSDSEEKFTKQEEDPVTENWIRRLYEDKMKGYNKGARPVKNPAHNTTVHLGLYLTNIDMDDAKQLMTVSAWSIMTWTDEHLSWEPKNYMNIDRIHFDVTDIWVPDMAVYNSADPGNVVPFVKVPVVTDNHGRTYWFPPTHFTVHCDMDISRWPTDEHECLVRMGSWSHHGQQIDIQIIKHNETTPVMMSNYEKNNEWDLLNVQAKRDVVKLEEGHENYVEIDFTFRVKRLAKAHATYITTTALVVMIIVLSTYALPLDYFYSRMIMHIFSLGFLIACYLTLFSNLPTHGGPIPFVVRYYSGTTVLTLISMIATLFLTTHVCCDTHPSSNLGKRVAGIVASAPGVRAMSPQTNYTQLEPETFEDSENPTMQTAPTTTNRPTLTASQVKRILNFLLFVLFLIAFFVDYFVLRSVTK